MSYKIGCDISGEVMMTDTVVAISDTGSVMSYIVGTMS